MGMLMGYDLLPKPGDVIRLKNGRTEMVVIDVDIQEAAICFVYRNVADYAWTQCIGPMSREPNLSSLGQWLDTVRERQIPKWRSWEDFVYMEEVDGSDFKCRMNALFGREKEEVMSKLYKKVDEEKYYTKLAKAADGRWVMEPKGGGDPIALKESEFEEVVPYSIQMKNLTDEAVNHYEAAPEMVEKGDLLISDRGTLWVVLSVDCKVENPRTKRWERYRKLETTALVLDT